MKLYDARKKEKRFKWYFYIILFFQKNKIIFKKLFIYLIIFSILFFPVFAGNIIGNWIKDFFGTIVNIIKTI